MAISQQTIKKLRFEVLKNLRDFEIDFKSVGLTGILGPNGCGKSTLLYALACIYQPNDGQDSINYKFSQFFTPTNQSPWTGSKFSILHDFRNNAEFNSDITREYTKQADRWAPKYSRRPKRYVSFSGIRTCVPAIELESQSSRITFNTTALNDAQSTQQLTLGGRVMNRNYTSIQNHLSTKQKTYLGLTHAGIDYSALNMGAGEQRIFQILGDVIKCPNYSLILIDEIDLLMHEGSLQRLLPVLNELSIDKNLQIVFTTHNHSILNNRDVEFRHIQQTASKTICHSNTNTEALFRLTGQQLKPYEIFAEDILARFLIKQIAHDLGVAREVKIVEFGAAFNCFTSVSGAILNQISNLDNMIFVLDGDVFRSESEKRVQINKVLTGNMGNVQAKRDLAIDKIKQFIIPEDITPERHYRNTIIEMPNEQLTPKQIELKQILIDLENPPNDHQFITELANRIGLEEGEILTLLSDMLRITPIWHDLTQEIHDWLSDRITNHR